MSPALKTRVILMADDDGDDCLLTREALSECQIPHDLRHVENGVDLLAYLRREGAYREADDAPRPDLILLDLNMPRKDGREALAEIKSDPALRRIPVVVLTTSKADTDIGKVYDLGANSFITKPAVFDDLVGIMKTLGAYWFGVVQVPWPEGERP